jgi:hypothetical protein
LLSQVATDLRAYFKRRGMAFCTLANIGNGFAGLMPNTVTRDALAGAGAQATGRLGADRTLRQARG